jgi:hypothetical protein
MLNFFLKFTCVILKFFSVYYFFYTGKIKTIDAEKNGGGGNVKIKNIEIIKITKIIKTFIIIVIIIIINKNICNHCNYYY